MIISMKKIFLEFIVKKLDNNCTTSAL